MPLQLYRFVVPTLVACLASGCYEPPLRPRDPTPGAEHYLVQTYNIFQYPDEESTIEAIGEAGADIIALQEVSDAWVDILIDRYSADYPYMLFRPDGTSGLGVLSRFPVQDGCFHEGENGWHPAWTVWVDTPAGTLQLLMVHLSAVFDGRDGAVRSFINVEEDHVAQISAYAEAECDDRDLPTIVLGDFNESPDGAAVRYLEDSGFLNLLPAYRPGQWTWQMRSVGGQLNEAVDHILVDDRIVPLNAYVVPSGASDHIPVVAHIEAQNW